MKIEVLKYTENPLTTIGVDASFCYNTKLKDDGHARRIAEHCIRSGHGRNMEFPEITVVISEISARMGRELYTHIIGTTRVQASTRYIDYDAFMYYVPENIASKPEALSIYVRTMEAIREGYKELSDMGFENDDTGYLLPLSMHTTIVLKINMRALHHMAEMRLCNRALKEFRNFMALFKKTVAGLDSEWKWFADSMMKPKCINAGYCIEDYCCGLRPRKKDLFDENGNLRVKL